MSSSEPIDILLRLDSEYWKDAPKAKVYLDNIVLFDGEIEGPLDVRFHDEIPNGLHKLSIKMYDKDKFQTKIEDGKIVKDQLIKIEKIMFDEIDLGYLGQSAAIYRPVEQPGIPLEVRNCINLGYNGTWELGFTTPIYIWLLENL